MTKVGSKRFACLWKAVAVLLKHLILNETSDNFSYIFPIAVKAKSELFFKRPLFIFYTDNI